MTTQTLQAFFMWSTIVNFGLLLLSFTICAMAGDWIYRMHTRWFAMPRETWNVAIYSMLGVYKMLVIVTSLVPYIVMCILSGCCGACGQG